MKTMQLKKAWILVAALLAQAQAQVSCRAPAPPGLAQESCGRLPVIRFAEHLCRRLGAGEKRITLRSRHRTAIHAGERVQLVCMESRRRFLSRVTAVRHTTWRGVSQKELRDDGFTSRERMIVVMRRYYPKITWDDPATVYRFERAVPCP